MRQQGHVSKGQECETCLEWILCIMEACLQQKSVYGPEDLESQGLRYQVPVWNGTACKEKGVLFPCGSVLGSTDCRCFVSQADKLIFNILGYSIAV